MQGDSRCAVARDGELQIARPTQIGHNNNTNYTTTNNALTDNEGGTRGTASGGATGASGKSSTATRVIREKNKPVASMITQQKNLKRR